MSLSLGIGLGITQQRGASLLGPELITDGEFPDNTNWSEGLSWLIASGTATHDASTNSNLTQSNVLTGSASATYLIEFDCIAAAGTEIIAARIGDNTNQNIAISTGVRASVELAATGTVKAFTLRGLAAAACEIDNVSVREVL